MVETTPLVAVTAIRVAFGATVLVDDSTVIALVAAALPPRMDPMIVMVIAPITPVEKTSYPTLDA